MNTKKLQLYFFMGLLLSVGVLAVALFRPFIAPLALAFMASIVVRPVNTWFLKVFKHKRTLSAFLTVVFVLVAILAPLTILIQQITVESVNFYTELRTDNVTTFDRMTHYIVEPVQKFIPGFNPDIAGTVKSLADGLVSNASNIFSGTAYLTLSVFIAIFALFYMLRDGAGFRKSIVELSPLADTYDNDIIEKIERAVNSVVHGSLFASLLQGTFTALGFVIFGVPHALLWGAVAAVASLLPNVGTALVVVPGILFLLSQNAVTPAIGLGVWALVAIGTVDNVIIPIIVGKGFTVHPLLILLSVLGGLAFFGPVGLFLGPLVMALLSALLEIYRLIVVDDENKKTTSV